MWEKHTYNQQWFEYTNSVVVYFQKFSITFKIKWKRNDENSYLKVNAKVCESGIKNIHSISLLNVFNGCNCSRFIYLMYWKSKWFSMFYILVNFRLFYTLLLSIFLTHCYTVYLLFCSSSSETAGRYLIARGRNQSHNIFD